MAVAEAIAFKLRELKDMGRPIRLAAVSPATARWLLSPRCARPMVRHRPGPVAPVPAGTGRKVMACPPEVEVLDAGAEGAVAGVLETDLVDVLDPPQAPSPNKRIAALVANAVILCMGPRLSCVFGSRLSRCQIYVVR